MEAFVTDVQVYKKKDEKGPPPGYLPIERTAQGNDADLNKVPRVPLFAGPLDSPWAEDPCVITPIP